MAVLPASVPLESGAGLAAATPGSWSDRPAWPPGGRAPGRRTGGAASRCTSAPCRYHSVSRWTANVCRRSCSRGWYRASSERRTSACSRSRWKASSSVRPGESRSRACRGRSGLSSPTVGWRHRSPSGVLASRQLVRCRLDRDQPGLEELGVPDGEDGIRQVHIRDGQIQRLTARKPGPVEEQQDRPEGLRFDAACGSVGTTGSRPANGGSRPASRCTGRRAGAASGGPSATGLRPDAHG